MLRTAILFSALGLASLASACAPALALQTPVEAAGVRGVVERFCAARASGDPEQLLPLLTRQLEVEVRTAVAFSDAAAAAYPDEKPPLGDGLPLASVVDGVGCAPGRVWSEGPDRRYAEVRYEGFSDRLDLAPDNRIRNVVFGNGGDLRRALAE